MKWRDSVQDVNGSPLIKKWEGIAWAINALVKKSDLIEVKGIKWIKRPKITLVVIKKMIKSIILDMIEWWRIIHINDSIILLRIFITNPIILWLIKTLLLLLLKIYKILFNFFDVKELRLFHNVYHSELNWN